MSTTAPPQTAQLRRAPGGLVWHRLLDPSGSHAEMQQPLPRECDMTTPPDRGITTEVKATIVSLVAALVEVLAGRRPPHQLQEWTSAAVADHLERLCNAQQHRDWRLRSLRAQQPNGYTVEATVHVIQGGRSRAVALRISRQQQRWVVTEFCITPIPPA